MKAAPSTIIAGRPLAPRLIADATPTVLYRQHGGNLVGAPPGMRRRAAAALRRGPEVFMRVLRGHVAALRAQPHLLSPDAAAALDTLHRGLHGRLRHRLAAPAGGTGWRRCAWPGCGGRPGRRRCCSAAGS